jgi:uncharacterized protein (TIGR00369 family)
MDTHDAVVSFRAAQSGYLPGHLGLDWSEIRQGFVRGHFEVGRQHLAPNGYLHAAAVVALADTAWGYGCIASLPEGATGLTTVELKANFVGTAHEGIVRLLPFARLACKRRKFLALQEARKGKQWQSEGGRHGGGKLKFWRGW